MNIKQLALKHIRRLERQAMKPKMCARRKIEQLEEKRRLQREFEL